MSATDLQSASRCVDDHRECLYRYALVRVRKPEVAEEMDDVSTKEVCATLSINLWVLLHRARMALRRCLETKWFDMPAGGNL